MEQTFELGQKVYYVDGIDTICEGEVTRIVIEKGKEPTYYIGESAINKNYCFLNLDDLCDDMIRYYEEQCEYKKNRIREMRDKILKEE